MAQSTEKEYDLIQIRQALKGRESKTARLGELLEAGHLSAAVIPRPGLSSPPAEGASLKELFDSAYTLHSITAPPAKSDPHTTPDTDARDDDAQEDPL